MRTLAANVRVASRGRRGFTMGGIMVVVAIIGFIMAAGVPTLYRMMRKEGMRKAVSDVVDICDNARKRAILRQATIEVVFHPEEGRCEVVGGGDAAPGTVTKTEF